MIKHPLSSSPHFYAASNAPLIRIEVPSTTTVGESEEGGSTRDDDESSQHLYAALTMQFEDGVNSLQNIIEKADRRHPSETAVSLKSRIQNVLDTRGRFSLSRNFEFLKAHQNSLIVCLTPLLLLFLVLRPESVCF